jgi:hypothetical protein
MNLDKMRKAILDAIQDNKDSAPPKEIAIMLIDMAISISFTYAPSQSVAYATILVSMHRALNLHVSDKEQAND